MAQGNTPPAFCCLGGKNVQSIVLQGIDLGLVRSATAFSITNCLGKLGCKLVEMSLAASLIPPSLISKTCLMLKGRKHLVLLFLTVFETQHVPLSTQSYQESSQSYRATCVRSRSLRAAQSLQYLLTARYMYATKFGVCGCVYLRCTRNKGTLRFLMLKFVLRDCMITGKRRRSRGFSRRFGKRRNPVQVGQQVGIQEGASNKIQLWINVSYFSHSAVCEL